MMNVATEISNKSRQIMERSLTIKGLEVYAKTLEFNCFKADHIHRRTKAPLKPSIKLLNSL